MRTHSMTIALTLAASTLVASVALTSTRAEQAGNDVAIDPDDIGGVVTGPNGPEAGVWVIAETRDLPVRYIKAVVTDDRGRFVLPDLPKANYAVWARGYGLVDGPKQTTAPGKLVNLTATVAPDEAAAAQYYPAIYWFSMLHIPGAADFGGEGKIPKNIKQTDWLNQMKNNGCVGCHQLGQKATRTIPEAFGKFGHLIAADAMVLVRGKYERDEETSKLVVAEITPLEVIRERAVREVEITLSAKGGKELMRQVAAVLERHPGDRRVAFVVQLNGSGPQLRVRAATARRIKPTDHFVREVEAVCGPGSVVLK